MKTTCLMILLAVLSIALILTFLVNKEQRSMNRVSDTFIKLIRKFDSWQMMR
jgi:hypothetical protein